MILLIDNYDSFAYNLYQMIGAIQPDIRVIRNDALSVEEIRAMHPSHIVLSPGPGYPKDAGVCLQAAKTLGKEIPMLGVCLGHQAICEAFGATISHAKRLMHGKQSEVILNPACPLFQGVEQTIPVARYHSLSAQKDTIPACLTIVAETDDGEVMGVMHQDFPIFGLQFHPESILTPTGAKLIQNFLSYEGSCHHDSASNVKAH
jgi:anthranilate synthase component 2